MKQIRNGLFFGLGLVPIVIFSIWLFHTRPLWGPKMGEVDDSMFDKSQIQVGDVKLSRTDGSIRALGEVTNRSDGICGFLQLDCDLLQDGKVIAHEMAIVSNITGRSSRGFTVLFGNVPDTIDISKLRTQTSVAQALTLDD